jgi:hypothetical protein
MGGQIIERARARIPLVVVVIKLLVRARLLELVDEILVPLAAHQLDVAGLPGRAHRQRSRVLVAARVLDLNREAQQRPADLRIDIRFAGGARLLLQQNDRAPVGESGIGMLLPL